MHAGQTGSGKTFTMASIMRSASEDIFKHITSTTRKEFLLRLAAIEIYNEVCYAADAAVVPSLATQMPLLPSCV